MEQMTDWVKVKLMSREGGSCEWANAIQGKRGKKELSKANGAVGKRRTAQRSS